MVQFVVSHCQLIFATIVNLPNEQKGTHQDGTCLFVQQACRFPAELTFAAHAAPVRGFSAANDGAF